MRVGDLRGLGVGGLLAVAGVAAACVGSDPPLESVPATTDAGARPDAASASSSSSSSSASSSGSAPEAGADASGDAAPDAPSFIFVSSLPIYRGYKTTGATYQDHLYTAVSSDFTAQGYTPELPNPYFYLAGEGGPSGILKAIYRCNDGQDPIHHWLDFDAGCSHAEGPLGFGTADASIAARCGATRVVQLWHRPDINDYIYTYATDEQTALAGSGQYLHQGDFFAWERGGITCSP